MSADFPAATGAPSAWYAAPIDRFLATADATIIGELTNAGTFAVEATQTQAWRETLALLRTALTGRSGWLHLEFEIPRMGSRIDAVLITGATIVVLEFKVGQSHLLGADRAQAWDYALELKNFHAASHGAEIFPLLVTTEAAAGDLTWRTRDADGVWRPRWVGASLLVQAIAEAVACTPADATAVDGDAWGRALYRPTPTIVEAARALYARHTVRAITRSDAGATNLRITSRRVEEIIDDARSAGRKVIVFVTGVPGAGKTLVGLNVATRRRERTDVTHATYLSGNGPLVAVLTEALARDEVTRERARGASVTKSGVRHRVKAFIQNVHHFRDEGLRIAEAPPSDHVVIFDESQRAWNLEQTRNFMARRKGKPGFTQSEPEFLLSYMDRHADWAAVICLVGGGQEINTGEAGIAAWLDAVRTAFPHWEAYLSPSLDAAEYAAADSIEALAAAVPVRREPALHLSTSMRSFRAERVSEFVHCVLRGEMASAEELAAGFGPRYPVALTRNLAQAKAWVRRHARGTERFGLVASSQAMRLKPHAIDVRVAVDPVHYFLGETDDTRSSWYLEDAATEFHVQGLELDWVCVSWDADLRRVGDRWSHHAFRGSTWTRVHARDRQRYQENAYRVLLTRARQGMVIFVPPGDPDDATRQPAFYDETFAYLSRLGLPVLA